MSAPVPVVDVEALTRLAANATQGEWETRRGCGEWPTDSQYIAALSPDVVLALLDRLKAAEAVANRVRAVANPYGIPLMERGFDAARRAFLGEPDDYEDGWDIWIIDASTQLHMHRESGAIARYEERANGTWDRAAVSARGEQPRVRGVEFHPTHGYADGGEDA